MLARNTSSYKGLGLQISLQEIRIKALTLFSWRSIYQENLRDKIRANTILPLNVQQVQYIMLALNKAPGENMTPNLYSLFSAAGRTISVRPRIS